jgi:hypothetical protein
VFLEVINREEASAGCVNEKQVVKLDLTILILDDTTCFPAFALLEGTALALIGTRISGLGIKILALSFDTRSNVCAYMLKMMIPDCKVC